MKLFYCLFFLLHFITLLHTLRLDLEYMHFSWCRGRLTDRKQETISGRKESLRQQLWLMQLQETACKCWKLVPSLGYIESFYFHVMVNH